MENFKLKSIVLDKDGDLTLIGKSNGSVIAFNDPENVIIKFAELLDGNHTITDIYERLSDDGFQLTKQVVIDILENIFKKNKLVYNSSDKYVLSKRDELKYNRLLTFYMSFDGVDFNQAQNMQQKLFDANVLILGVGGTGGHTAHSLIASGIRHMTLVDYDNVEITNVTRQMLYDETNLGSLKISIAKDKLLKINPQADINIINKEIITVDDVKDIINSNKYDFIINTMDEPRGEIRYTLDDALYKTGIPYIFDGSVGSRVVVGPTIKKGKTESYRELMPAKEINQTIRQFNKEHFITNVIEPMNGTVGQLTAYEVIKYITGCSELATWGKRIELDMDHLEVHKYDYEKNHLQ